MLFRKQVPISPPRVASHTCYVRRPAFSVVDTVLAKWTGLSHATSRRQSAAVGAELRCAGTATTHD